MQPRRSSYFGQEENSAYNIILGSPTRWAISVGLTILLVMLVIQATSGAQKTKKSALIPTEVTSRNNRLPIRPLATSKPDQKCQNTQQGKDYITDDEGESYDEDICYFSRWIPISSQDTFVDVKMSIVRQDAVNPRRRRKSFLNILATLVI